MPSAWGSWDCTELLSTLILTSKSIADAADVATTTIPLFFDHFGVYPISYCAALGYVNLSKSSTMITKDPMIPSPVKIIAITNRNTSLLETSPMLPPHEVNRLRHFATRTIRIVETSA
jgi:hypothetical protein